MEVAHGVQRAMTGFRRDELGDWVADLSCLHSRHIRHRPPFSEAAWIEDDAARADRIGQLLDCPLCDRAELPPGLREVRTTATWDRGSAPASLLRSHHIGPGTWGLLRVERGSLRFTAAISPVLVALVDAEHPQPIPPEVEHQVELGEDVRFNITFLQR